MQKPVIPKHFFKKRPVAQIFCIALIYEIITELMCHRNILTGLAFPFRHPIFFLLGFLGISLLLSFSLFFRRRYFAIMMITIPAMGFAIADFILRFFRVTPLSFVDLRILKSVFSIIGVYLNWLQITLLILGFIAIIAGLVILFIKSPKAEVVRKKAVITCSILLAVTLGSVTAGELTGFFPSNFSNLPDAYENYGFVYCFTRSIFDTGVDEPEDYSDTAIDDILSSIKTDTVSSNDTPNIIFLQLESFFDVNHLNTVTFSENPLPNWTALKKSYTHGFLTVPVVGGGTANSEFEVLTGMSLAYFGAGEYPYTTILQSSACESAAYDLKNLGYATHAIHDNTATFYDRNKVYPNLGFDSFTSIEYMNNLEYTKYNWAKDKVLTGEILKALDSTKKQDFVFAVSVQGHGIYPSDITDEMDISASSYIIDNTVSYEYYVSLINEMDDFIGELIAALAEYDEPVMLVMYGDHLPDLGIKADHLDNNSIFQTEYVIWSNYHMKQEEKDLTSYQLAAYALGRAGITEGVFTKLHQNYCSAENYQAALEMLEYDVLYGNKDAYDGVSPYLPTNMRMGVEDIVIEDVETVGEATFIMGRNFTEWTRLRVNGSTVDTYYINENTLMILETDIEDGSAIYGMQVSDGNALLSMTNTYIYHRK